MTGRGVPASSSPATLFEWIRAAEHGDRPAIDTGAKTFRHAELIQLAESAAVQLRSTDLQPGDRVLLLLPNSVEHIVALLAVGAIGGIAVPLDVGSGRERVSLVAADTSAALALTAAGAPEIAGVETAHLVLDPTAVAIRLEPTRCSDPPEHRPAFAARDDSTALIRFTSGSTGRPKGVVLDHAQVLWTARSLAEVFGFGEDHRELIIAPMAFSGGWQRVAATLVAGGCVVLPGGAVSVSGLLEDVQAMRITGFFTPPPLIRALLATAPEKVRPALAGCRVIEIGSAATRREELERLLALAATSRVFVHYGLTECSRATILDTKSHPDRLGTVGTPAPGVELAVRDDDGADLGADQLGQIFLRGPQRATGYWNRPELTEERFGTGWVATGDYGTRDAQGFLTFHGRRDDRIECSGYSFFPAEVEAELGTVPGIAEFLIAGVPDPRGMLGDVPWAFVVPRTPDGWTPRDFLSAARAKLPPYMVPRWVVAVASLPVTASGKPDRRRAVELYASEAEN